MPEIGGYFEKLGTSSGPPGSGGDLVPADATEKKPVARNFWYADVLHMLWGVTPRAATTQLDSIGSRFNVLNTPISTTAPIDAKTHV
jgi:hypothetical protein